MGVQVSLHDSRVIVSILCHLDYEFMPDLGEEYEEEYMEEESDDAALDIENGLLRLLAQIRGQLMEGDYRALYAVWEKYGLEDDETGEEDEEEPKPPVPPEKPTGKEVIDRFRNMLSTGRYRRR